jgi:5'-nucleotidase
VRSYDGRVVPDEDPMGRRMYWVSIRPIEDPEEDSDLWAVAKGLVSLTPLRLDLTDMGALEAVRATKKLEAGPTRQPTTVPPEAEDD